jgi:hypothetical protein
MNKKLIFLVMLIGILVFGLMFVSCGGDDTSKLTGIWEGEDGDTFEFFKDGTGNFSEGELTWTADKGRLKMTLSGYGMSETMVMDYKLSGKTLILTAEGEKMKYTRK